MLQDKISLLKQLLRVDDSYLTLRGLLPEEEEDIGVEDEMIIKIDKIFIENKNLSRKPPTNLKVRQLVDEGDVFIKVSEFLPNLPFSILSSGTRGAGKSVFATNVVAWYKDYFDHIFIFSPTIHLDRKFKLLFEELDLQLEIGVNVFTDYSETVLKTIMRKIERFNKDKPFTDKSQVLFIFDDVVSSIPKNKRKTIFNRLILNNRHYAASVLINSQSFKLLDSNFRKVSSQLVLFKTFNVVELYAYAEELSAVLGITKKEMMEKFLLLFRYATKDEHSFLFINLHHPNIFFKNIDIPLTIRNDVVVEGRSEFI